MQIPEADTGTGMQVWRQKPYGGRTVSKRMVPEAVQAPKMWDRIRKE